MQTEDLEKRVAWWKWGIAGLAAALVIAYAVYFGWYLGQRPALDAEKWGQFGDFVGGMLNPVVAFAAFYWLTKSVQIQKNELAETKEALKKAAEMQEDLVKEQERNVEIAAIAAIVTNLQSELNSAREQLTLIIINRPNQYNDRKIFEDQVAAQRALIEKLKNENKSKIDDLMKRLDNYLSEKK